MPRIADAVEPVETTGTPISSMAQLLNSNLARQGARGRANMMPPTSIMDERYPAWKRNQEDAEKLMLATDLIGSAIPLAGPAAKGMVKLAQYAKPQVGQALENYAFQTGMALPMVERQAGRTFAAPQDEALRLAQERAALPVERGGLGLPPNNTSEQRAAAMGFDFNTIRFHGTDQNIYAFDPAKFGKNDQGWYGRGVTTDTDPKIASSYANYKTTNGQVVYPLVSRGKYLELPENQQPYATAKDSIRRTKDIQSLGYQGTQMTNDRNPYNSKPQFGTEQVTFDPENIRSRFAAFDPFRRNAAIAAAMGVAAPDLLAQERTKIKDLAKTK